MATSTTSCLICDSDPQSNYVCNSCKSKLDLGKIKKREILNKKEDFYKLQIFDKCQNTYWTEKGLTKCGKELDPCSGYACKDCILEMNNTFNPNPHHKEKIHL
jgi:hypothetical protein